MPRSNGAQTYEWQDRYHNAREVVNVKSSIRFFEIMFVRLMSRAGERESAQRSEWRELLSTIAQREGHHADAENVAEHWSVVCRSCDRRGARCLWCVAGFG